MKRLEIGPGFKKISPEWNTIGDFERDGVVDKVCEWGAEKIPYESNHFDFIYSSHCLEHVPWYKVDYALSETFRTLKKGGIFEVHVPNLGYMIECYRERKNGDNWNKFGNQEHYVKWFSSRLMSYGPGLSNYHKSCYDEEFLKYCLSRAGFVEFEIVHESLAKKIHGNINLGIKCKK